MGTVGPVLSPLHPPVPWLDFPPAAQATRAASLTGHPFPLMRYWYAGYDARIVEVPEHFVCTGPPQKEANPWVLEE